MELQQNNGTTLQNGTAKETNKAHQNGEAKHGNGTTAKKEITNNKPETEKAKQEPAKEEKPEAKQEQAPEPKKKEAKPVAKQPGAEAIPARPELTLEAKLKTVDDLHRRSIQRLNLISRIQQLEAFEVALAKELDELDDNPYQGCKLIIEDDKQRRFVTTTPGLIRMVSQFIFEACVKKRAELEATIVFPNV